METVKPAVTSSEGEEEPVSLGERAVSYGGRGHEGPGESVFFVFDMGGASHPEQGNAVKHAKCYIALFKCTNL